MFCFQCEQTRDNKGCMTVGVCGKTPEVASLQDLLIHATKGVSIYAKGARDLGGLSDREVDNFVLRALFSTVTNVNFDSARFNAFLKEAYDMKTRAKALYEKAKASASPAALAKAQAEEQQEDQWHPTAFKFHSGMSLEELEAEGHRVGVLQRREVYGPDLSGLQEMAMYGLKGMAAYAEHAFVLGQESDEVFAFCHEALARLSRKNEQTLEGLLQLCLDVGKVNVEVMRLLDLGATTRYGHPKPTPVRTTAVKGKCALISGHDLRDLEELLKQTEGKGINIYTHGEMLPAHGYPGLKEKYPHLVGNYGGAWQQQKIEFSSFPGPILMTTNCIIEPRKSYKNRIYTRSVVGWPGVTHIPDYDFSALVEQALAMDGFEEDEPEKNTTMTGFARNTVLSVADKVVDLVKSGAIKHFFLIGGCDGAEGERNYFKEMALNTPQDTMVLTLACGKYRFNKFFDQFGTIGGLPRMLDIGQCNDAYSAIQIASGLQQAFGLKDINQLPLSFVISWFEQKAVAVFLTLLHLGIKNVYLGPQLPAFATPAMLDILVKSYGVKQINNVQADMKTDRKSVV